MEELPIKIKESKKHKGLYHLVWKDGSVSKDCYNLSRAKDLLLEPVEKVKFNYRAP